MYTSTILQWTNLNQSWNIWLNTANSTCANATSAISLEISDSNLETERHGPKSGLSQIIWESWQPWKKEEAKKEKKTYVAHQKSFCD